LKGENVKQETTSNALERWESPDGDLVLCRTHADVVWERIGDKSWTKVSGHELSAYREGTGHDLPCGFCEAIIEAKGRGSL
jgi:hypothetical protein